MKIAFLILAHANPAQVFRLVDHLLINDCVVLIHIDKKNYSEFVPYLEKYVQNPSIKIYSEYKVYWGSYNQVRATFFLLNELLKNYQFDYVNLISGLDLPIKRIEELKHFLSGANGKDFVSVFDPKNNETWSGNGGIDRMRLFWFTDFERSVGFFYNKLNVIIHSLQKVFSLYKRIDFEIFGGANWFTLSYNSANYVNCYLKEHPRFFKSFKNTRCADEIILASIIMNSELKANIEDNYLRYIDWQTGPEYPRVFRENDFNRLNELQNVFFARKFDEKTDKFIIDKIYNEILS